MTTFCLAKFPKRCKSEIFKNTSTEKQGTYKTTTQGHKGYKKYQFFQSCELVTGLETILDGPLSDDILSPGSIHSLIHCPFS